MIKNVFKLSIATALLLSAAIVAAEKQASTAFSETPLDRPSASHAQAPGGPDANILPSPLQETHVPSSSSPSQASYLLPDDAAKSRLKL